jgi:branched-chain amino acid transport system permease protein
MRSAREFLSGSVVPFGVAVLALAIAPLFGLGGYALHLIITALLWSYIYTCWSLMGRVGLVSFGHGAFIGVGAYTVVLAWNFLGWSPWLSAPLAVVLAVALAAMVGWPCFRFGIVGHYFAIVTLALAEIVRLVIVGLRNWSGGTLGVTPRPLPEGASAAWTLQFTDKRLWFYVALAMWLIGLAVWRWIDRSMHRTALEAISEDEQAAASVGIDVTRTKMGITLLSAALTCLGGVVYALYMRYINPDTVSGLNVSLQIVFGVIAGGMSVLLGPTVGALLLLAMSEGLRLALGNDVHGLDRLVYGALLVLFIMYLPRGIVGEALRRRSVPPPDSKGTRREAPLHP